MICISGGAIPLLMHILFMNGYKRTVSAGIKFELTDSVEPCMLGIVIHKENGG